MYQVDHSELGRLLLHENVRSVMHRYGPETIGHAEKAYATQLEGYIFRRRAETTDPVQALKFIASWRYQTCEHPGHAESKAWQVVDKIERMAIRALPGYREARWAA